MARSERAKVAERIVELVGDDILRLIDVKDGWPALAELEVEGKTLPVSLFAAPVGLSHRDRDDVERRFQNPGSNRPITVAPSRATLLVGLWEADPLLPVARPLLVTADAHRRVGRPTRFSVFVPMAGMLEAANSGWSTNISDSGESIRCLLPPLLPVSVSADHDGTAPITAAVQTAVKASGLIDAAGDPTAADRARRATMSLVRDARFSKRVITAYDGLCAMCGLGITLVQGAHIYPASAPKSQDEPWNGLALCPNHHLAFDRHLVGVQPTSGKIVFKDEVLEQAATNPAVRVLVETTFPVLAHPNDPGALPRRDMFELRYSYFPGQYDWLVDAR